MATSGSVDYSLTRDNIIKAAYQKIGRVGEGGTPTSDQYTEGALLLNAIVKSWNAGELRMPLWAVRHGAIFPQSLTTPHSVLLGPNGGHASLEIIHTTLTADSAASDTTLTVDSITNIAASDNIGVELDNGNIDWTTVSGSPSGSTVTLAAGVTTAASTGRHVYAYTTKIDRPLRIIEAWTRDFTDSANVIDTPMDIVTVSEYNSLSAKATEGYPLKLSYEPLLVDGLARYWPGFSNGSKIIVFRYHRALEDFDATGDTPDFPQEWYLPLIYELACALAPNYGVPVQERYLLRQETKKWVETVSGNDYEEGSIYFYPRKDY